jgi:hypothetical protein
MQIPRLVKGGKWVYAWVILNEEGRLRVPEAAWEHYGFHIGDMVIVIPGSRKSGGFGLTKPALLTRDMPLKQLATSAIDPDQCVQFSPSVFHQLDINPPATLLAVRGSRVALGFIAKGLIYEEALKHKELETLSCEE